MPIERVAARSGRRRIYACVVSATWVPVGWCWLGHRPEPFLHERLWACPLTGAGPCRALVDEHGRGLAYQQPGGRYEERTTYEPDRIVVTGVVETLLEHGRRRTDSRPDPVPQLTS